MRAPGGRVRLEGARAIEEGLARGDALARIVVPEHPRDAARIEALLARARERGIEVLRVGDGQFERLRARSADSDALALVGAPPDAGRDAVLAARGAAWLLTGTAYPGNAGFAIRTAEVSGADAVFVDAGFDHAGRREALRVAMRADRFLPVFWEPAGGVLDAAAAAGRRLVALEDSGAAAPWEVDLTDPTLFVVGHEREGVAPAVLARCDAVVRLPMAGFLRSYNLHAAVAAVAVERLRQLEARGARP